VGVTARLPARDLDYVLGRVAGFITELQGAHLFITGGTGFIGCWLLETFLRFNEELRLGAAATVLTRNPDAFRAKAPHLSDAHAVSLLEGDVRTFRYPAYRFTNIIHAATDSNARLNAEHPSEMFDTVVAGTRHVLDFAVACGAQRFLFASSGAVYGRQPPELSHVTEDYPGAPDTMNPGSAYGEGKRAAELLCRLHAEKHGLETKIARGFAFVGPHLPLDAHYAVGNFIRDGLSGGPIQVNGNGTPYRSYLHAADLAVWLWTILLRGKSCRPYNVGSERAVTIAELAHTVAAAFSPKPEVVILGRDMPDTLRERYVPSTGRAASELGLHQTIDLNEAIARQISWHRQKEDRRTNTGCGT